MARRLFALDHNFPEPVLAAFGEVLPMVDLVPVRAVEPGWAKLDDWELLVALRGHPRPWDGLITSDDAMLSLAKEMTVLSQTGLSLVVAKGEGHNPIRAVGALLCHLPHICHHTTPEHAQIWTLRVAQKNHEEVRAYLDKIAQKASTTIAKIVAENRVPNGQLRKPEPA